ncbi:hypothetical protein D3C83_290420 [compost metagenome]
MVSFDNDWTVFFTRPISGAILALSLAGLLWPLARLLLAHRRPPPPDAQAESR